MSDRQTFHTRLAERLGPVVAAAGYELLAAQPLAGPRLLRLYIDHANGIGCDDCAAVSRLVSDWLDVGAPQLPAELGWLADRCTLEVSSPGLDRPLTQPAHFARFAGQRVEVHCCRPIDDDGRRKVTGALAASDAVGVVVDDGHRAWQIGFGNIDCARLVPAAYDKGLSQWKAT